MKKIASLLLLSLVLLAPSAFARDLKEGMTGDDVKQWQSFLIKRGYMEPPALGTFSARTLQATIDFQKSQGLQGLGMVGPKTIQRARALGYGSGVAAKSAAKSSVKDPAIFPGKGMGKITLRESRTSVIKKLGKPTESFFWGQKNVRQDTWIGKKSKSRLNVIYFIMNSKEIVFQIESTSPEFYTAEGFSIKSSLIDTKNLMSGDGKVYFLRSYDNGDAYFLLSSPRKGIAVLKNDSSGAKFYEKVIVFPAINAKSEPLMNPNEYDGAKR